MRIRQIKPEFYLDDELAQTCSPTARLLFTGLWVIADRKGRLEDRPAKIKAQIFPYDDDITIKKIDGLLSSLSAGSFIVRYSNGNKKLIQIRTFEKHQHCHIKEPDSKLPGPDDAGSKTDQTDASTVQEPGQHRSSPSASGLRLLDNGFLSTASGITGTTCPTGAAGNGLFEQFWKAYPRHENPKEARKSWDKIHPDVTLLEKMLVWIEQAKASDQWQSKDKIPHPTTWLNQQRWLGDPPPPPRETPRPIDTDWILNTETIHGKRRE